LGLRAALCSLALLAAGLCGCSTVTEYLGDPNVQPGKFQFLRCRDIAEQVLKSEDRRNQLRELMDRSASGTGGSVVNVFAYQPELDSADAELRLLRRTAAEKQCPPDVLNAKPPPLAPVH
jgi:hypothetical protein